MARSTTSRDAPKEAAGSLTDDQSLKNEGKTDKLAGKVKEKVEDAKDWVEDKVDAAKDKSKH